MEYTRENRMKVIFLAHLEDIRDVETIDYFKQFKLNKDLDGMYFIKVF